MEGGLDYMEKLINTIIESVKEKKVQSYGKKILNKFSFKSKNDLSNIVKQVDIRFQMKSLKKILRN